MNKACAVCGSYDTHLRSHRDEYDCSTCKSVVTGMGEHRAKQAAAQYLMEQAAPEYSVAAEQRRQLGLIATLSDRLDKLNRAVNDLGRRHLEDPNFPAVLASNFRRCQQHYAEHKPGIAEFSVFGSDGYLYSVRVSQ